jgi:hypothetical protein
MLSILHRRLLREMVVLCAIFAMVLGPLALVTSRSLSAQERVNIAAGLVKIPLCNAGDTNDGLNAKMGGGACDHCISTSPALLSAADGVIAPSVFFEGLDPANTEPSALLKQISLPPATGPPAF